MVNMTQNHAHKVYSVSELTDEIKQLMEDEFQSIWVEGEISNFVHHQSGHMYFSLKDADSTLRCVMFRNTNRNLAFQPKNGVSVRVFGSLSVYAPQGSYQLIVAKMDSSGLGDLHQAFERLKQKLMKEGLFDAKWKKPIPAFPKRIGVVTSPTGAAISDIVNVISRRYPIVDLVLCPAAVQGSTASEEIVRAIRTFQSLPSDEKPDVLIVGRGGGSIEDLWPFNEENVARAVFACDIPIISAVGHEIDFTICDFVADHRAPTPSAAAESAVPDKVEIQRYLNELQGRLNREIMNTLELKRLYIVDKSKHKLFKPMEFVREMQLTLDRFQDNLAAMANQKLYGHWSKLSQTHTQFLVFRPDRIVMDYSANLTLAENRLITVWKNYKQDKVNMLKQFLYRLSRFDLERFHHMVDKMASALKGHNPRLILEKGYAICSLPDKTIVSSVQTVQVGERVNVSLYDGRMECKIQEIKKEKE